MCQRTKEGKVFIKTPVKVGGIDHNILSNQSLAKCQPQDTYNKMYVSRCLGIDNLAAFISEIKVQSTQRICFLANQLPTVRPPQSGTNPSILKTIGDNHPGARAFLLRIDAISPGNGTNTWIIYTCVPVLLTTGILECVSAYPNPCCT